MKDATCDVKQISAWWARWPAANIAVATGAASGLVALDIDPPAGEQSLAVLLARLRLDDLPETPAVITGRGGLHLFFLHPGWPISNSAGRLGAGVDVRADGGYVIVPPSQHASMTRYVWAGEDGEGPSLAPWQVALAPLPGAAR